jgi:hypothetical protein
MAKEMPYRNDELQGHAGAQSTGTQINGGFSGLKNGSSGGKSLS